MNDLEQQLARQELKRVPPEWRDAILSAAASAQPRTVNADKSVPLWRLFIWPSPRAWIGLAAAWVLMLGLHLAMPSVDSSGLAPAAAMNASAVEAWREQQRLLAELVPPERRAELPKALPPRRRSQLQLDFYFA